MFLGPSTSGGRFSTVVSAAGFAASVGLTLRVAVAGPVQAGPVRIDELSVVALLVVTGLATVVHSYASRQLDGGSAARRFFLASGLAVAGTVATAVADRLSLVVAGWILTSAAVCALVAAGRPSPARRQALRRTALALGIGDAALLGGVVLLVATSGDLRFGPSGLADAAGGEHAGTIALLLAIAVLARSAQVPLPRWLPTTLATPTPVSALLHAGVVNAGAILLIRCAPLVTTSRPAVLLLAVSAGATAVVATAAAAVRTDVKGALAHSTSAQMGFMLLQCAAGLPGAAMLHFAGHAMYKASSFLGAGDEVRRRTQGRHAPSSRTPLGPLPAALLALLLPAGALAATVTGLQAWVLPHGGGPVIVGVLWLALGHATWGWLRRPAADPPAAVAVAAAGNVVIGAAYLSAASLLERFLWPVVGPASEGWLSPTALAIGGVAVLAGAAGAAIVPTLRRTAFAGALRFAHLPAPARPRVGYPSEPVDARVPALRSAW